MSITIRADEMSFTWEVRLQFDQGQIVSIFCDSRKSAKELEKMLLGAFAVKHHAKK